MSESTIFDAPSTYTFSASSSSAVRSAALCTAPLPPLSEPHSSSISFVERRASVASDGRAAWTRCSRGVASSVSREKGTPVVEWLGEAAEGEKWNETGKEEVERKWEGESGTVMASESAESTEEVPERCEDVVSEARGEGGETRIAVARRDRVRSREL